MRDCLGSRNANTDLRINRSREVIVFLLPFSYLISLCLDLSFTTCLLRTSSPVK